MNTKQSVCAILLLAFASVLMADGTTTVIKVTGKYAIISKGVNQGLREGMVLSVIRRKSRPEVVGEVNVIRATANRAAVRRTSGSDLVLLKGDMLYTQRETTMLQAKQTEKATSVAAAASPASATRLERRTSSFQSRAESRPATGKRVTPSTDPIPSASGARRVSDKLRNPWLAFTAGAIKPNGAFALSSTAGTLVSGSYMVAMGPNVQMGLEVGQSFMGIPGSSAGSSSLSTGSSSLFSAMLVFQKFFGDYFFLEGGGGMFRPKITVNSLDGQKDSYSATHFGLVGGAGMFVPTSPYAGLILKSRFQNYFDNSNKNYLAFSGGFRFKIR